MKKKLVILPFQHDDLVWRRCFERDIEFDGKSFIPYADIEELYIKNSVELCEKYPEYKFQIECVAVLRKFLERNPEYAEKIQVLLDNDRVYIPFTGDNIVDSNLIDGESIIRNFLYGYNYLKENFAYSPEGFDRMDAFGNSGQLPQIARGFGQKWMSNISYSNCDGDYFRGIDGSTVFCLAPKTVGGAGGGVPKYPPCPECKGHRDVDCPVCKNTRIDEHYINTYGGLVKTPYINQKALQESDMPCVITSGGEEIVPNDDIILWARENADKYDISFGARKDFLKYYTDKLEKVDSPDESAVHGERELNCNNTGVFVTRIKLKQGVRQLENAINTAETTAVAAMLKGNKYPKEKFAKIWEQAHFTMFHDAVTGTIVDDGYAEITDTLANAEKATSQASADSISVLFEEKSNTVTVFNPNGIKVTGKATVSVPTDKKLTLSNADILTNTFDGKTAKITFIASDIKPFGKKEFHLAEFTDTETAKSFDYEKIVSADAVLQSDTTDVTVGGETNTAVIENDFYTVFAETNGITKIVSKETGKTIAEKSEYLIGEWILEHDEGSPWATLSTDMTRQPLASYTKLVSVEKTDTMQKMIFKVEPDSLATYSIHGAKIEFSVSLPKNSRMIYFSSSVKWDTQSYRLRIAFPTESKGEHIYEIPYGKIARKPYKPNILKPNGAANWSSAAGDYPAHNWAGVEGEITTAVFNKGTPSYQINTDACGKQTVYLTPLRSPSVAAFLHSPNEYTMTAYDGMRDVGEHSFEYGLSFYADGFDKNTAVADGIGFNTDFVAVCGTLNIPQLPTVNANGVRISSIKAAENGDGIILRLVEYHGNAETVTVNIPEYVKSAFATDLKEDIISPADISNGAVTLTFRPYEIKNLLIKQ